MNELKLDGKIYVSSKRAAEITGYAKDYIGQLSRAGKLDSKMVGRNWYINKDSLQALQKPHKHDYRAWAASKVTTKWPMHKIQSARSISTSASELKARKYGSLYPRKIVDEAVPLQYESDDRTLLPDLDKGSRPGQTEPPELPRPEQQFANIDKQAAEHSEQKDIRDQPPVSFAQEPRQVVGSGEIIPSVFDHAFYEREEPLYQDISQERDQMVSESGYDDDIHDEYYDDVREDQTSGKPYTARLVLITIGVVLAVFSSSLLIAEQRVYKHTTDDVYTLTSASLRIIYPK